MHDIVIRDGDVVEGTGSAPVRADVAIDGDTVTAVGRVTERGAREIDAEGLVVAPGFVDVHTHFDAQAFWDPTLSPSPLHGVTTVMAGSAVPAASTSFGSRREQVTVPVRVCREVPVQVNECPPACHGPANVCCPQNNGCCEPRDNCFRRFNWFRRSARCEDACQDECRREGLLQRLFRHRMACDPCATNCNTGCDPCGSGGHGGHGPVPPMPPAPTPTSIPPAQMPRGN